MAQEGSPTPRRALEPLPEEPGAGGRFAEAPESPSPLTSTGQLRRLAASPASPVSPVDPLEVPARTPVPPPAPVLPEPESALPASAGRRFSASAEPDEFVSAAPRRSAASATSPASAIEPILPPAPRPKAPPAVTVPTGTPTSPFARTAAAEGLPGSVPTAPSAPAPAAPSPAAGATAGTAPFEALTPTITRVRPATPTPSPATSPTAAEPVALSRRERKAAEREAREASKRQAAADKAAAKAAAKSQVETAGGTTPTTPAARVATTAPTHADQASAEGTATPAKERTSRPALIIIAAVAAVAVLVAAGVWLLTLRSGASSGGPTNSVTASALDPLLTATDLGALGGVAWTDSTGTSDAGRPICIPDAGNGLPNALRTASRKIVGSGTDGNQVMQVVDTYADAAAATTAYSVRLAQAGTCADDTAWIAGANAISGLADSADAVRLVVQDATNQFHTLLLSRTGRSVNLVDVTTTKAAVKALDLAKVMAAALSRQCGGDLGTCPSNPSPSTVPPPAGNPKGWLVEGDLPRVTPGEGRWGATDPFTNLAAKGSQCEVIDLENVPGTQSAAQRTLLLAGDSKAPQGFGVDVVTYTFANADAASTLATKLNANITKCPSRAPTATVVAGPAANGTGTNGAQVTGSTYLVTQKSGTTTLGRFRVAIVTVGTRLVYVLANPESGFDFTDSEWKAIAVRAGQRASQA